MTVTPDTPMQVNDGSAQRSVVDSLTLRFSHPVTLAAGALTLAVHAGQTGTVPTLAWSSPDGGATWVVSFSGAGVGGISLADGVYDLTVHANLVTDAANNTLAGGDQTFTFHRLFGDINGDGQVTNADAFMFRNAFNTAIGGANYNAAFDYNGDGQITNTDYFQFRARFMTAFTY